jgi:hypothetical protein
VSPRGGALDREVQQLTVELMRGTHEAIEALTGWVEG